VFISFIRVFDITPILFVSCSILCIYMIGFWTVLADGGVSTKHLVALLFQLIKNGQEVRKFMSIVMKQYCNSEASFAVFFSVAEIHC